jgi:hypothetical protein
MLRMFHLPHNPVGGVAFMTLRVNKSPAQLCLGRGKLRLCIWFSAVAPLSLLLSLVSPPLTVAVDANHCMSDQLSAAPSSCDPCSCSS